MAEEHKLSIFRGLIKFRSSRNKLLGVLVLLTVVTLVEVGLGIIKPPVLFASFMGLKVINWIFIILTIVKAYYITWDFMHVRDELTSLKVAVLLPLLLLIPFLVFILINEGSYVYDVLVKAFDNWKF